MKIYDVGDKCRFDFKFTRNGSAVDPDTVVLSVKDPSAHTDTYSYAGGTITKTATGTYWAEISVDEAGEWLWRVVATGDYAAADQGRFVAQPALV